MKTLGKVPLPAKFTIDGCITQNDPKLIAESSTMGVIEGLQLVMPLQIVVQINGFEVQFKSTISHTFDSCEFNGFMTHCKQTIK